MLWEHEHSQPGTSDAAAPGGKSPMGSKGASQTNTLNLKNKLYALNNF